MVHDTAPHLQCFCLSYTTDGRVSIQHESKIPTIEYKQGDGEGNTLNSLVVRLDESENLTNVTGGGIRTHGYIDFGPD